VTTAYLFTHIGVIGFQTIDKEIPVRTRTIVIGLVSVSIVAVLAPVLLPRLLKPEQAPTQPYWPTQDWRTSTPEEQGFDSGKLADGLQALQEGNVRIGSLPITRNGYVVLDAYFYPYDNPIPHKLASVTKSFMTTLIGIAVDQGKIQPDQPGPGQMKVMLKHLECSGSEVTFLAQLGGFYCSMM
jgi:hypothetical protein